MAATPLDDHNCLFASAAGGLSDHPDGKSGYAVALGVPGLPLLFLKIKLVSPKPLSLSEGVLQDGVPDTLPPAVASVTNALEIDWIVPLPAAALVCDHPVGILEITPVVKL